MPTGYGAVLRKEQLNWNKARSFIYKGQSSGARTEEFGYTYGIGCFATGIARVRIQMDTALEGA
ncbi:hypothetical protein TUMSATVNIG3_50420 [Vibrio nigripulchritudo]|nr:hypothetical protein TUMSATVNIG2_49760 [Vibrio nigripulchritudo]BDU46244.1 hypothetical protein TUMSATVNIG3_50420 [Vibrio nigripulchritudo]